MPTAAPKPRYALYAVINLSFVLFTAIACAAGGAPNPRFPYLVTLFAVCSTPVIDLDAWNGRLSLLGMFLLAYFTFLGVGDLSDLVHGRESDHSQPIFSLAEAVIVVGALLLILGYRIANSIGNDARRRSAPRDWPLRTILVIGLLLWAVGTYATYSWYVYVVKDVTLEATHAGLAKLNQVTTIGYLLAQMLQPLGILLIAYAWRTYRITWLLAVVGGMVGLQVVLGFIIDIKGVAMNGGILVIAVCVLVDGKIPKAWLAGAALFVFFVFPIFQAYRAEVHGNRGIARTTVVENLGKAIELALAAEDKVNSGHDRAQTFFERLSLKASVQMIVGKTGSEVPFQDGYTLTPIISTFVPRILWSDKPDIPTGQIVNKVFHISEQEETYISPSHIGELYWNFGWPGVVVGMTIIGAVCGVVGRYNLAEARTVTRLFVTVLTIQQVIHGFEGSLASAYVVYFRSLAAVAILHLAFARNPLAPLASSAVDGTANATPKSGVMGARLYPNLMN